MLLATLLLTMTALTAQAETFNYLDASGASRSHDATPVTGSSLGTNGSETWYVVNSDVELTSGLDICGTVHLILADNKTLSVPSSVSGIYMYENSSLTIYSQSLGSDMGKLVINSSYPIYIGANSLTINGGDISVTTNYNAVYLAAGGSMTINNGTVSLTGSDYGVNNENGFLTINGGTVTITAQTPIYNVNNYTKTGGTVTLDSTSGGGTVNVIYLDASGNSQSVYATPVTGRSLGTNGSVTWYVVNSDVELTSGLSIYGTVHLILADNTTLSVNANDYAIYMSENSSLTIYSQSLGSDMGKLVISSKYYIHIDANSLTINGGDISVTTNDSGVYLAANGSMTINNGTVSLTGSDYGVENDDEGSLTITGGTVTITAQTPIYNVNNYTKTGGTVTLKDKSGNAYYKVLFDANGGSDVSAALVVSGGTVSKPEDPTRDGYVFVGWYNGANEYDFTAAVTTDLTLTAKWGKNIANCTATVPDQVVSPYDYSFNDIGSKFDYANNNVGQDYAAACIEDIGAVVMDGSKTLVFGTDYVFGTVAGKTGNEASQVGDEYTVQIVGQGDYAGTTTATFKIKNAGGAWGDLTWSLASGTLTISGEGTMNTATTYNGYGFPWVNYRSQINSVVIVEGITSIADKAFGETHNHEKYENVTAITLPSTLTSIGANAFNGCTNSSLNITIPTRVTSVGDGAFNSQAKVTATLSESIDNTSLLAALKGVTTADLTFTRTFEALSSGEGKASTVCLPFDLNKPDKTTVGMFYSFGGVSDATGEYVVTMNEVTATTLTAGTPYMFKPATTDPISFQNDAYTIPSGGIPTASKTTDTNGWEFRGTYQEITWPDGQTRLYAFAASNFKKSDDTYLNEVGAFRRFDYGHANPFRCYLWAPDPTPARGVGKAGSQLPESMKVILVSASGETTGIGTLDTRTGVVTFGDEWYSLDGRKLDGKPTKKGLYINKGKTVVIK